VSEPSVRGVGARPRWPRSGGAPHSRADEVYRVLRQQILDSELAPDEPLVEEAIAKATSLSRTPVREALHRLEMDGLVRSRGRSVVVATMSVEELSELCIVRESLEGLAARLAAAARSDVDVSTLERLLEEMRRAASADDLGRLVDTNHAFHEVIWTSSRNRYLAHQLELLRALIERRQSTTLADPRRRDETLAEHAAILEGIARRDAGAAEDAATVHFRNALASRMLNLSLSRPRGGASSG
jgi:DNA-binding GntR family transcriptional regulator